MYIIHKETYLDSDGCGHSQSRVKYFFSDQLSKEFNPLSDFLRHPSTDDNPCSLFRQIAGTYKAGDEIITIPSAKIRDEQGHLVLEEPLSGDELRMLFNQVANELKKLENRL